MLFLFLFLPLIIKYIINIAPSIIIFEILNIILIIIFVLVGGILPLIERKYLALVQRRVGPKFVGYKGRLQFIADALKVLFKDYFYLYNTNKNLFFLLPIFFLNLNLLFFLNIVFYGNCFFINIEYNIIFFLIFSALSNIFIFFVGFISKNKYSIITSNRVINIFFINELFISIILLFLFFIFNSFSFSKILFFKKNVITMLLFIPILPVILFLFLIDINKVPFDLVEAESELIMGYHIEYTGFLFGLFVLIEYLHLFFFIYLLHLIFSII